MDGQRVDLNHDAYPRLKPGEYGKDVDGLWYCCPPQPEGDPFDYFMGCLGDGVRHHKIVEHDDGTITVSPSIQITRHDPEPRQWHGYLERGVWRIA